MSKLCRKKRFHSRISCSNDKLIGKQKKFVSFLKWLLENERTKFSKTQRSYIPSQVVPAVLLPGGDDTYKSVAQKTPLRNFFVFRENLLSHVLAGIQHDDELLRERKKILFSDVFLKLWIVCKKIYLPFYGLNVTRFGRTSLSYT